MLGVQATQATQGVCAQPPPFSQGFRRYSAAVGTHARIAIAQCRGRRSGNFGGTQALSSRKLMGWKYHTLPCFGSLIVPAQGWNHGIQTSSASRPCTAETPPSGASVPFPLRSARRRRCLVITILARPSLSFRVCLKLHLNPS